MGAAPRQPACEHAGVGGRWRWLGHPLFLANVIVLALNDHVLKLLVPSWWTGKLSDVAGVVVVGTLASVLTGPTPGVAVAGVGFSLLKLVPGAAELAAPILGGVAARDPSDLVALLLLAPLHVILRRREAADHAHLGELASSSLVGTTLEEGRTGARLRPALAAVLPVVGAFAAVLTATATSCGPAPAVTQVTEEGSVFYALVSSGFGTPKWARSDDGGRSWRRSAAPKQNQDRSVGDVDSIYRDEPTGPTEACAPSGTCYRLLDRRLVQRRAPGTDWAEEARLSDAELDRISTGCAGAQRGVLRSIAAADAAGRSYSVASLGAHGALVRQDDGRWVQVGVLGASARHGSAVGRALSFGGLLLVPVMAAMLALFGRRWFPSWLIGLAVLGAGWVITTLAAGVTSLFVGPESDSAPVPGLVALLGSGATTVVALGVARLPRRQPSPHPR